MRKITIERLTDDYSSDIYWGASVKKSVQGNVTEITYQSSINNKQTVQMLPGMEQYVVCDTGEIRDVIHKQNRSEDIKSLKRTFKHLRELINCNTVNTEFLRWITLTYAENMTNPKVLYKDFEKLIKKLRYHFGTFEYITVAEPQGRGAWHMHLLIIFNEKAPYIDNNILANYWGHGFTQVKAVDNSVDNVGAYLTAYLTDVPLDEYEGDIIKEQLAIKQDKDGKKYVKGARLHMYPPGMRLYRCSRGIKRPIVSRETYKEALQGVGELTYKNALHISSDSENGIFEKVVITETYNARRKNNN